MRKISKKKKKKLCLGGLIWSDCVCSVPISGSGSLGEPMLEYSPLICPLFCFPFHKSSYLFKVLTTKWYQEEYSRIYFPKVFLLLSAHNVGFCCCHHCSCWIYSNRCSNDGFWGEAGPFNPGHDSLFHELPASQGEQYFMVPRLNFLKREMKKIINKHAFP